MTAGLLRIIGYVLLVLLPLLAAVLLAKESENAVVQIGKTFALAAFMILALQSVLAARIKWIEKAFGFDILIRFHKHMALFATFLLVCHPVLLAVGGSGWKLILGIELPRYIWLGKGALMLLVVNTFLSAYQPALKMKFEC
jgi:predicted ferric reductase